jgi:hypothetical protein
LVSAKEKELLFNDWSTNRKSAFIASRLGPVDPFFVEEKIVGVQLFILQVVVNVAVEIVLAASCHKLKITATGATR